MANYMSQNYTNNMGDPFSLIDDTITLTNTNNSVLTTNGISANWNSISPTWSDYTITSTNLHNALEVKGDANIEGDLKVKGISIVETLEKIEEKLAILHPNKELESRWERLRQLREEYIKVEKELLDSEKMWNILKK